MLSICCPDGLGTYDIESIIAERGRGYTLDDVGSLVFGDWNRIKTRFKDPILMLGDAYEKSKSPKNRGVIAHALRRGFSGLGVCGKNDDDFVKRRHEMVRGE